MFYVLLSIRRCIAQLQMAPKAVPSGQVGLLGWWALEDLDTWLSSLPWPWDIVSRFSPRMFRFVAIINFMAYVSSLICNLFSFEQRPWL